MPKKSKINILLIQLPIPTFGFKKLWGNIPLAAGYLKAMAHQEHLLDEVDVEILDAKTTNLSTDSHLIDTIIARKPDIVGFSLYVWNSARSLFIAEKVKENLPNVLILVGGPEIASDNDFVLDNPVIDIGCLGEGEIVFVEILKNLLNRQSDFHNINGLFFREGKEIVFTPKRTPMSDLNCIPSPYLLGIINPKDYGFGWIESVRGCPFRCKYCAWKDRPQGRFSTDKIIRELELFKENGIEYIKFLNSDILTTLKDDKLCQGIRTANPDRKLKLYGFVSAEQVDDTKADLLEELGFTCLGIGLQSTNPETLKNLSRKFNPSKYVQGCHKLMERGIRLELEYIIGLPRDHLQNFREINNFLEEHDLFANNKLGPLILLMLPGTTLREESGKYGISYHKTPPYHIIQTDYLSKDDIQAACGLNVNSPAPAILDSMISTFDPIIRHSGMEVNNLSELNSSAENINKILLPLNPSHQSVQDLKAVGDRLKHNIIQPFTLWCKARNVDQSLPLIQSILLPIVEKNPFLICNIILESGQIFPKSCVEAIQALPFLEKDVNSNLVPKMVRVHAVFPWQKQTAQTLDQIVTLAKHLRFLWSITVSNSPGWKDQIRGALEEPYGSGCLIDLDPQTDPGFTIVLLQFLSGFCDREKIRFRNVEMNVAFDLFSAENRPKIAFDVGHLETMVTLDKDLNLGSFFRPSTETRVDLVAFQMRLNKRAGAFN